MKSYICVSQPCGFEGNHRLFLKVYNDENRTITTYDKKNGKQVYHRPHNIPFNDFKQPEGSVLCPKFIMPMIKKYLSKR